MAVAYSNTPQRAYWTSRLQASTPSHTVREGLDAASHLPNTTVTIVLNHASIDAVVSRLTVLY